MRLLATAITTVLLTAGCNAEKPTSTSPAASAPAASASAAAPAAGIRIGDIAVTPAAAPSDRGPAFGGVPSATVAAGQGAPAEAPLAASPPAGAEAPRSAGGKPGSVGAAVADSGTGLSEADIRAALAGKVAAFNECQSPGKGGAGDVAGTVVVRATIGPSGSVERAEVASSTTRDARVDGCVLDAVRLIQFPRTQVGGIANIPFELGK